MMNLLPIIINVYKFLKGKSTDPDKEDKIKLFILSITDFLGMGMQNILDLFFNNRYLRPWCEAGTKLFVNKKAYHGLIYYLFDVIPSGIVGLAFFYDVCLMHKFEYFYKCLILLLIPLIYNIILYCLHNWVMCTLEYLKDFLIVKEIKSDQIPQYEWIRDPEPEFSKDDGKIHYLLVFDFQASWQEYQKKKINLIKYFFAFVWFIFALRLVQNSTVDVFMFYFIGKLKPVFLPAFTMLTIRQFRFRKYKLKDTLETENKTKEIFPNVDTMLDISEIRREATFNNITHSCSRRENWIGNCTSNIKKST